MNNEEISAMSHSVDELADHSAYQSQGQGQGGDPVIEQEEMAQHDINGGMNHTVPDAMADDVDHHQYDATKLDEESAWTNSMEYDAGPVVSSSDGRSSSDEGSDYYDGQRGGGSQDGEDRSVDGLLADLSCLCRPTCVTGPRDLCSRSGAWALANADQFISSIIVAISLIPESISYALIAGLPPSAALQSCWITNVITAAIGGRPGMITSASGLAALLLYRLVRTDTVVEETGIMFVPYVIMFAGILQCLAAFLGLGRLVSSFPAPVVVGMVNAIALLILALQFRYAKDFPLTREQLANGWDVEGTAPAVELSWNISIVSYFGPGFEWISPGLNLGIYAAEVATAFAISMFLPKLTTFLPATLLSVLVVVAVEFGLARQYGVETPLIGDYGGAQVVTPWETIFTSKYTLPSLVSWESWKLILGYGFTIFATQFTETAIALNVVDRLDESQGPGFQVLIGQGISNVVSGIFGGMGGSGVVSMSVLADRTFGTTCLSTFMTGLMMFVFITWGYPVIDFIPLSAISGISIAMVCSFIQWRSMMATFTICLPSRKRDVLPPQYNIARLDVFIMLFVTTACLIVDISTMLFFVMGLSIFLFTAVRGCCERRSEKQLMNKVQDDDMAFQHSDQSDEPEAEEVLDQGDEGQPEPVFPSVPPPEEDYADASKNSENDESCPDCRLMESAEELIFPSDLEDHNQLS